MVSEGRDEDYRRLSKVIRFFLARDLPNLRQEESSSLVSTSLTHSGDDEDSEDSGIMLLFFCWNLRNLPTEPSSEMLASFTGRVGVPGAKKLFF